MKALRGTLYAKTTLLTVNSPWLLIGNNEADMEYRSPVSSPLEQSADPDHVVVNIGPSHPATHGTIQVIAELDGETVK